jgi:hypothetical protein
MNTNENSKTVTPGIGTSDLWLPILKTIRFENCLGKNNPQINQQKTLAVVNPVI